jgi:hypothetical protein
MASSVPPAFGGNSQFQMPLYGATEFFKNSQVVFINRDEILKGAEIRINLGGRPGLPRNGHLLLLEMSS